MWNASKVKTWFPQRSCAVTLFLAASPSKGDLAPIKTICSGTTNPNSFETSVYLVRFKKDQPFDFAYLTIVRRISPKTVLTPAILGPDLSFCKQLSSCISLRLGCLHHPSHCKMIWIRDQDKTNVVWLNIKSIAPFSLITVVTGN